MTKFTNVLFYRTYTGPRTTTILIDVGDGDSHENQPVVG